MYNSIFCTYEPNLKMTPVRAEFLKWNNPPGHCRVCMVMHWPGSIDYIQVSKGELCAVSDQAHDTID